MTHPHLAPPPEFVEMLETCSACHLVVMTAADFATLLDLAMEPWEAIDDDWPADQRESETLKPMWNAEQRQIKAVTEAWRALLSADQERGLRLLNERRYWATETKWNPGLVDRVDALVHDLGLEVNA